MCSVKSCDVVCNVPGTAYSIIHADLKAASGPEDDIESAISFGGSALFGKFNPYNSSPEFRQDSRK